MQIPKQFREDAKLAIPVVIELAYQRMHDMRLIYAGSKIAKATMENILDRQFKEDDPWFTLGPFLQLKTKIESEGFFITQQGCEPPGFRILTSEEMAEHAQKILMKNLASNFKTAYIMASHDVSGLDEGRQKIHHKVQKQAAQSALHMQKMLLDQNFF